MSETQCDCGGTFEWVPVENCSCHISPPCGACTNNPLTCSECGEAAPAEPESPSDAPFVPWTPPPRPYRDLGDGKALLDFHYDGSSGSTMVWTGRYEGPVTAEDIIRAFGTGTFGHRGPHIHGGRFTYTLITD